MQALTVRENSIAIVGWDDGGAGQVHSWIEHELNYHVACFVHPNDEAPNVDPVKALRGRRATQFSFPSNTEFKGLPLLVAAGWPSELSRMGISKALIMTPNEAERERHIQYAVDSGVELINAIHPSVLVMEDAIIGKNVVAHARGFIGYRAELHDGVILNTGVQIEHHTVVQSCATLDPAVVTNGNVTIERRAHVNPAAIITKRCIVGADAIVAAGAVVLHDVAPRTMVAGVPARHIRSL